MPKFGPSVQSARAISGKNALESLGRIILLGSLNAVFLSSMVSLVSAFAQGPDSQVTALRDRFFNGEFGQTIAAYSQLSAPDRELPLVKFWVGQSYLREHDIDHAQEFLRRAKDGNLAPQQDERAQASLDRISTLRQLCPPFYHDYNSDGYTIRIYANDTPWAKSIAAQMPTFFARAKEAFGNRTTYIAFYLFDARTNYSKFFESWDANPNVKEHRGTGAMHIVMFCRYFPTGVEIGGKNISDLYCRVLHEYSHALCHTIYGDNFKMPQWLNEGMADYFGWKYNPLGVQQSKQRLKSLALEKQPPTYEEISTKLHDDNELGYPIGDVMVSELLEDKPLSIYGQIIDVARASGGNFEYALKQTTGKDPRAVYAKLVETYWPRRAR